MPVWVTELVSVSWDINSIPIETANHVLLIPLQMLLFLGPVNLAQVIMEQTVKQQQHTYRIVYVLVQVCFYIKNSEI